MRLIHKLMRHFYRSDIGYWIYTNEIKVPYSYLRTRIGKAKFLRKNQYFDRTGEFESKIILDKDFTLLDGYSSYVIAKKRGIKKVPVYFQ